MALSVNSRQIINFVATLNTNILFAHDLAQKLPLAFLAL